MPKHWPPEAVVVDREGGLPGSQITAIGATAVCGMQNNLLAVDSYLCSVTSRWPGHNACLKREFLLTSGRGGMGRQGLAAATSSPPRYPQSTPLSAGCRLLLS